MVKRIYLIKSVLIIIAIFVVFVAITYLASDRVILSSFSKIEKDNYKSHMEILGTAIEDEKEFVKGNNLDWSVWDDSYIFVTEGDPEYISVNVSPEMLANLGLDYFAILNNDYEIKYIQANNKEGEEVNDQAKVSQELKEKIVEAAKYYKQTNKVETETQEFFYPFSEEGLVLTSVANIIKSDSTGPVAGYMLMGEFFNEEKINKIAEKNNLKLNLMGFEAFIAGDGKKKEISDTLQKDSVAYDYLNNNNVNGYLLIKNAEGKAIGVIKSSFVRDINLLAIKSRNYYLIEIYAITLLALIVTVFIINRLATSRKKQFEGETKYQLLFNENVIPLILIKIENNWNWKKIVEVNNAAKKMYKFSGNDNLMNKPINLLNGMNGNVIRDFLTTLMNLKISVAQGDLLIDQRKISVEAIGRIFEIEKEKYLLLTIKDLSERVQYEKKLEDYAQNLKKFQLAVENASDQIVITDSEGVVIFANKSLEAISGYTAEEIVGKKAGSAKLWGGLMEKKYYERMWKTISLEKNSFIGEMKNKRKNGKEYDAAVSISPILNGKGDVIFYVGIERDITKAKEIDRAKTEFVSLASHQLRTPLSSINWFTEMLLGGDAGKINKTQKEYLDEIYKGNKRMVALVNALLNTSRIDLGTFAIEPESTNIVEISKDVVKETESMIEERQIKVEEKYDKLPMIMLDPKLVRVIFQNLISNAVKYSPGKGKVIVSIKKIDENIEIRVSDMGYGIPKDQQDKIFTKLFRADNVRAMDTEGSGLGLYIVKSIVEELKGKIWFTSEENKGTTFCVDLPMYGIQKKVGAKPIE